MTNPKKRLKKGIKSLGRQVVKHREKQKTAVALGNWALMAYYNKEIERLEAEAKKRKLKLEK